jgi:hypothetical protein
VTAVSDALAAAVDEVVDPPYEWTTADWLVRLAR